MKLLLRLLLTILSFFLVLTAGYHLLPYALTSFTRYQLTQRGFTDIEVEVDNIGFESATVRRLQMFNEGFAIRLQGLQAEYQLSGLLSGVVESIKVDHISLSQKPGETGGIAFPGLAVLEEVLTFPWHENLPVELLAIDKLLLYDEQGVRLLNASGELRRQEHNVSGNFDLVNASEQNYFLSLETSPEAGLDIQLFTPDESGDNPLSINMQAVNGLNGLSGQIELDLPWFVEQIEMPESLSGRVRVDIAYMSGSDTSKNKYSFSATVFDAAYANWQMKDIVIKVNGSVDEQGDGYRLNFSEPSKVTMQLLEQEKNTHAKLILQFPESVLVAHGGLQILADRRAEVMLSNMKMDSVSIPDVRLSNISFSGFMADKNPDSCAFNMDLNVATVEMDNIKLGLAPVLVGGICSQGEGTKWRINASVENIHYEDESYRVPLNDCELTLGNSDQGKFLDENPMELGGSLECRSGRLSGEILSRFRFNPLTGVGSANFSVSEISPDDKNPLIGGFLKGWKQPFDIVSGSLSVDGNYRWWRVGAGLQRSNLSINLKVNDAGGFYEGVLFSGLNYAESIQLLPSFNSSGYSKLGVDLIDIGIPINRASARIQISESSLGPLPLLTIDGLVLPMLDGKIEGNNLKLDLNAQVHNLPMSVEGLSLAKIADLQQLDGMIVTGLLDGTIPVTVTEKGVRITDGRVVAKEPGGRVQYNPQGGTANIRKSAPGSELVLQILEELIYNSLVVDVNYKEDGEMEMKLAIQGMSPNVDTTRPVHFNLNLQQNVLTMLKALRYAEGISEGIDRNVRDYFGKRVE